MAYADERAAATEARWSPDLGIALALVLATLAVYSGVTSNGFVSFDDPLYILNNPHVSSGLSLDNIAWAFSSVHSDNWHPLTWLSHMLDCQLFGLNPSGHHAISVLLHALNGALFFFFLRHSTDARWPSFFAAALFALHPLRVESVAWASERKDLLSTLFFLLTLLAYARYVRAPSASRYALMAAALGLGLLSKPMLVTVPLVLILLDYWPLQRTRALLPSVEELREKLPLLVMAGMSAGITLYAQSGKYAMQSFETISLPDRVANAMVSSVAYLGQWVWPDKLAFFYPHPSIVDDAGWSLPLHIAGGLSAVAITTVTVVVARLAPRRPHLLAGWLWYGITLAPVIGIIQVGGQSHADRYTYLPMMGIAIAICFEVSARIGRWARPAIVAGFAVLVLLGVMTHRQVAVWHDSFSLYHHALAVTVNNYVAANNLGADHAKAGAYGKSILSYERAIEMRPDYAASYSNMGIALERIGQPQAALASYRRALELDPGLAQAHVNLGSVLAARGDLDGALGHYERAAAERPESIEILSHYASIQQQRGELDKAIEGYERALELAPDSMELHTRIAGSYLAAGREKPARTHLEAALARDPHLIPAADRLAWLLSTSLDPEMRDGATALRLAKICTDATQNLNPRFLQTRAAAHAELGEFQQAVSWQRRAAELTPIARHKPVADRIDLYEADQPLRIPAGVAP